MRPVHTSCEVTLRLFRWFSVGPIPTAYDLRRLGWQLLADERSSGRGLAHAVLGRPHDLPMPQWLTLAGANLAQRKWMMMIDVRESTDRARMLRLGSQRAGRRPRPTSASIRRQIGRAHV